MIKMVVTDIDGTLVAEGADNLDPELFEMIRKLKEKGILFVAGSGRTYGRLKRLFRCVFDDIIIIAENGSVVRRKDETLSCNYIERGKAEELVKKLRQYKNGHILFSTPDQVYIESGDPEYHRVVNDEYHIYPEYTEDVLLLCDHTNKISIFMADGVSEIAEELCEIYKDRLNAAQAGKCWLDFSDLSTDKGNALQDLQQLLGISKEETMAFGDNCNDVGMILAAGESYAVENAHPLLLEAARFTCPGYQEHGVLKVIREKLLQE